MTTQAASIGRLERWGDRANAILVKETRQALKGRQFVVTFMLLLSACWLISVFGLLLGGAHLEFGAVGTEFFHFYFLALAFAVLVIVPFGAYRSLLAEREEATYELLSITTLTPRQIIRGKLLSAAVQMLVLYSAITPFIAFTSLLQGFELVSVLLLLVFTMLASLLLSMMSLMISSLVQQRFWRAITTIGLLGGLCLMFWIVLGATFALRDAELDYSDGSFWWAAGIVLAAGMSLYLLFQQIAQAQLTFESDNRSTGLRLVCSGQVLLLWGALLAYTGASATPVSTDDWVSAIRTGAVLSALYWFLAGLFMVTEPNRLSRRIERALPRNPLVRLMIAPLAPGGSRAFLFVLAHLSFVAAGGAWTEWALGPADASLTRFVLSAVCYAVIYLGAACALCRWFRAISSDVRPGHVRVLTLILLSIGCIAPYVPMLFGFHYDHSYTLLMITNPLATLEHVADDRLYAPMIWPILLAAAGMAVFFNLLAIQRGLQRVVAADVPGPPSRRRMPRRRHRRPESAQPPPPQQVASQ